MGQDHLTAALGDAQLLTIGPLQYRAAVKDAYLLVQYSGKVATCEVADEWLAALDDLLLRHDVDTVLWDSRPADPHPSSVRSRIWTWLEAARVLKRSAIIVESEMLRLSANLSSTGRTLKLRAFVSFDDAHRWLTGSSPTDDPTSATEKG